MNSELRELLRIVSFDGSTLPGLDVVGQDSASAAEEARAGVGITPQVITIAPQTSATERVLDAQTSSLRSSSTDVSGLAVEVSRLVEVTRTAALSNVAPPKATSQSTSSEDDGGVAGTVLKTAAMFTGVGPIVSGLMKLFGSGDPEPLPPLEKFVAPSSISVEAGLTTSRDYAELRYAQGGRAEVAPTAASEVAPATTVQVNIQAMDSQSFLDRQDDIARAVREAMLHSNSLNDIVMEL